MRRLWIVVIVVCCIGPLSLACMREEETQERKEGAKEPAPTSKRQIAFVSERNGNRDIYLMDEEGKNEVRLTDHEARDSQPSWSPDGKKLAFISERDNEAGEIYLLDLESKSTTRVTSDNNKDSCPVWHPNGEKILFFSIRDKEEEMYEREIRTGKERIVAKAENRFASRFCLSTDGKKILFSNQSGFVKIFDVPTTTVQKFRRNVTRLWHPSWSPDGTKIVLTDSLFPKVRGVICVVNNDGEGRVILTDMNEECDISSWSSDGKKIVFVSRSAGMGENEIWTIDADGNNKKRLTNDKHIDTWPAYRPQ